LGQILAKARDFRRINRLLIRRAQASDLGSISAIEHGAHLRPWSRVSIAKELANDNISSFWVACQRPQPEKVAGYICFRIIQPELYILNLAVEKGFRRRGIGSCLILTCLGLGLRRKIKRAVLDVHRENERAIGFYQGLGFQFSDSNQRNKKNFAVMEMHFP